MVVLGDSRAWLIGKIYRHFLFPGLEIMRLDPVARDFGLPLLPPRSYQTYSDSQYNHVQFLIRRDNGRITSLQLTSHGSLIHNEKNGVSVRNHEEIANQPYPFLYTRARARTSNGVSVFPRFIDSSTEDEGSFVVSSETRKVARFRRGTPLHFMDAQIERDSLDKERSAPLGSRSSRLSC